MTPPPEKFTATKPPETKPEGTNHIKALDRNLWRRSRPTQGFTTSVVAVVVVVVLVVVAVRMIKKAGNKKSSNIHYSYCIQP
jgi:hypothetical protein